MFYQNSSPDVVRRGNVMEYYSSGFCSGSNEERTLKVTLLGYKVMEEKTKFTVRIELFVVFFTLLSCMYIRLSVVHILNA